MAVNEDQIRKLIKDYEVYKKECMEACTDIGSAKAGLYHIVLHDLNELLPRKTLSDVSGGYLEPYVGTWVEYGKQPALIVGFTPEMVQIAIPRLRECYWVDAVTVYPLDIPRVWDENGEIVY